MKKRIVLKCTLGFLALFCVGMAAGVSSAIAAEYEVETAEECAELLESSADEEVNDPVMTDESGPDGEFGQQENVIPEDNIGTGDGTVPRENAGTGDNTVSGENAGAGDSRDLGETADPEGIDPVETPVTTETPEPLEEPKADLKVTMTADAPEIKAGKVLKCEIVLENTGEKGLGDIRIASILSKSGLQLLWKDVEFQQETGEVLLSSLVPGEKVTIYAEVQLPEDLSKPLEHTITVTASDPEDENMLLHRSAQTCTSIVPLKIDFEVEKKADRTTGQPGDVLNYSILIRNTGERTLHSVISTERFLNGGIKAAFVPQEGILLNKDRSQAYIASLAPGAEVTLGAVVTLPDEMPDQKLINQVLVATDETGSTYTKSEATVEIKTPIPTPTITPSPTPTPTIQPQSCTQEQLYGPAAVQTGDETDISLWIRVGIASFILTILLILAGKRHRSL